MTQEVKRLQEKRVLKVFSIDNGLEYVLEVLLVSSQLPTGGCTELTLVAGLTPTLPPPPCHAPHLLRARPPALSRADFPTCILLLFLLVVFWTYTFNILLTLLLVDNTI